jgi:integrase
LARQLLQGRRRLRVLQHTRTQPRPPRRRRKFRATVKAAGLDTKTGRVSPHSLRHTYASLLIANGLDVVFVSRQLGHANPKITLATYAHLFDQADHAKAARTALDTSYATMTGANA